MSYDMSIGDEDFNYTWNVSDMWYDFYKDNGIREIYGQKGKDAVTTLRLLRDHMENNRERMIPMEPGNGWGTFDGALMFVNQLIGASFRNPELIWDGD